MTFSKEIHVAVSKQRGILIKIIKFERLWLKKKLSNIRFPSWLSIPSHGYAESNVQYRVDRYGNRGAKCLSHGAVDDGWLFDEFGDQSDISSLIPREIVLLVSYSLSWNQARANPRILVRRIDAGTVLCVIAVISI